MTLILLLYLLRYSSNKQSHSNFHTFWSEERWIDSAVYNRWHLNYGFPSGQHFTANFFMVSVQINPYFTPGEREGILCPPTFFFLITFKRKIIFPWLTNFT